MRLPRDRPPTHPGETLFEEFLKPLGMTQKELAKRARISYPRVNELVHGKPERHPRHGVKTLPALRHHPRVLALGSARLGSVARYAGTGRAEDPPRDRTGSGRDQRGSGRSGG